jgi:hypothetical protein
MFIYLIPIMAIMDMALNLRSVTRLKRKVLYENTMGMSGNGRL